MRLAAIAAAVALASGLAPSSAAVITDTQSYFFNTNPLVINFSYFPTFTFDPTLGKLDSVRFTISAPGNFAPGTGFNIGDSFVTVTPGHSIVLTARADMYFSAFYGDDGNSFSKVLNLPTIYLVAGPPSPFDFVNLSASYPNFYATFAVNPALFAGDGFTYDGTPCTNCVTPQLWGSIINDPVAQCVVHPYCHWHWYGDDGGFSSGGTVTATYWYTPIPAKVPEPPSWALLAGAVVALGATRLTRS